MSLKFKLYVEKFEPFFFAIQTPGWPLILIIETKLKLSLLKYY